jgi:multiple sugar transport system substrate-binding protein
LSKLAANKDAAWTFIEFANSVEGQTIVAASGRTVPSLKSVAESTAFLDPNAKPSRSNVFLDSIPFIRGVPVMETWVDIESTVGNELERGMYGQASADDIIAESIRRTDEYFLP